jgi:hypothetical protein
MGVFFEAYGVNDPLTDAIQPCCFVRLECNPNFNLSGVLAYFQPSLLSLIKASNKSSQMRSLLFLSNIRDKAPPSALALSYHMGSIVLSNRYRLWPELLSVYFIPLYWVDADTDSMPRNPRES